MAKSVRTARTRRPGRWLWPESFRPWDGTAARADLVLLGGFAAVILLGFALRPAKPFLVAEHPVALQLVSGDLLATGAAAAFARAGEVPLWLVVAAGVVGTAKLDWLLWWAGRRWGEGMIRMIAAPQQAARYSARARNLSPWVVRVAVALAVLPGIPTPVVLVVAGMAGMRLVTFLALDLVAALLVTSLVAGLGYALGQHAVDLVLIIDQHASRISLALLVLAFLVPWVRALLRRRRRRRRERPAPSGTQPGSGVVSRKGAPTRALSTTVVNAQPVGHNAVWTSSVRPTTFMSRTSEPSSRRSCAPTAGRCAPR